jgi:protein involved in ribonucleotide reduction
MCHIVAERTFNNISVACTSVFKQLNCKLVLVEVLDHRETYNMTHIYLILVYLISGGLGESQSTSQVNYLVQDNKQHIFYPSIATYISLQLQQTSTILTFLALLHVPL